MTESQTSAPAATPFSIVDIIPFQLVMMLAHPYLAGSTAQDALAKAHKLYKESRFASTIDILGEDARTDEDCDCSVENYKNLIDLISSNQIASSDPRQQVSVSFKPSMFSTAAPEPGAGFRQEHLDRAYERIESLVKHAEEKQVRTTVEAEDHVWTDFYLDAYISLINAGYSNCGTVIQSRLLRIKNDLKRFDERMRVRMLIGIYNEPGRIAMTQKPQMKAAAVEYAAELLGKGVYVELASHDVACLKSFIEKAVLPTRSSSERFEIQHLLGVPRQEVQQALTSGRYFAALAENAGGSDRRHLESLAASGALVRMYLPFGQGNVAGPYCKRRLKANPDMIGFGIKNLLHMS